MLTSFDNLPEVNSLIMGYHPTGYECALSQRWSNSPLLQTLYVTSYHQDNDIRYITGIFDNISSSGLVYNPSPAGYYAAKLTSSQANGNYGGGQIASGSSQYHYVWWTGSQIYSLSNLTGPGITVQATQHPAHGLLRTSSSSTSNIDSPGLGTLISNNMSYFLKTLLIISLCCAADLLLEPLAVAAEALLEITFIPKSLN